MAADTRGSPERPGTVGRRCDAAARSVAVVIAGGPTADSDERLAGAVVALEIVPEHDRAAGPGPRLQDADRRRRRRGRRDPGCAAGTLAGSRNRGRPRAHSGDKARA